MPWTTPGTATAGEVLTAAFWNTQVRDNSNHLIGAIRNIQQTTKVDTTSRNTNSYADITGLTVTITPSATTSKIILYSLVSLGFSGSNMAVGLQFARGGTALLVGTSGATANAMTFVKAEDGLTPAQNDTKQVSLIYVDSPASTSALTYSVQWRPLSDTVYLNRRHADSALGSASLIIAAEIA